MSHFIISNDHLINNNTVKFTGRGVKPEIIFNDIKSRIRKIYNKRIESFNEDPASFVISDMYDFYIRINKNTKFAKFMIKQGYRKLAHMEEEIWFIFKYNDIVRNEYLVPATVIRYYITVDIMHTLAGYGISASRSIRFSNTAEAKELRERYGYEI